MSFICLCNFLGGGVGAGGVRFRIVMMALPMSIIITFLKKLQNQMYYEFMSQVI